MRKLLSCAALGLVLMACCAASRPYTIDDLLNLQELNGVSIDPTERWLVVNTLKPRPQAGRYDYLQGPTAARGRPLLVDLAHPGPAEPFLPSTEGMGYTPGPFSPDGARLAVYRHKDDLWELGVVTLATRHVRWMGVSPDIPLWGSGAQWRSSAELVVLDLAPGDLPAEIRRGRQAKQRLEAGWAATAGGMTPSYTRVGSGRYAGDRDLPPPRSLLSINVLTGETKTLASGQFKDIEISPDGRFAAAIEAGAPTQPDADHPPRMIDFEGRRMRLAIFDLSDGTATRPTPLEVLPSLLSWSADNRLLIFTRADGQEWRDGELQEFDAGSGKLLALTSPRVRAEITMPSRELGYSVVQAGWNGANAVALARAPGAGRADWYALRPGHTINLTRSLPADPAAAAAAPDGFYVQSGDEVWRVQPGASERIGKSSRLMFTPRTDGGARAPLVNLTAKAVWLQRSNSDRQSVRRLGDRKPLSLPSASQGERPLVMTRHGAVTSTTDAHGLRTLAVTSRQGRATILTLNPGLADVQLPDRQPLKHKTGDGKTLTSWLYTPAGLKPGERAPLIVLAYPHVDQPEPPYAGLPSAASLMLSTNLFVAAGYAVLDASYQRDPNSHDPGEGFTQALLDAADAAIRTGKIDPDRMALAGHSFGAYATMLSVTRTTRFKAAVAAMGPSDLASFMLTPAPHYRSVPEDGMPAAFMFSWGETGQGNLGVPPWQAPERYVRNSPVYQAGTVTTPILIVSADQEWGSVGQGEEMFSALWRQNKDAKLLTFWGETHVFESPANIRAYWTEMLAFLDPLIGPASLTGAASGANRASQVLTQASTASRSNTSP